MSEMSVADTIADRMKKDPKVASIVADAQMFDQLQQDPGWRRLFEKVQADKQRFMDGLARRMFGPKKNRPSDEEIAFQQGFYQGAIWILSYPDKAMENLERTARLAWALTLQEESTEEGVGPQDA